MRVIADLHGGDPQNEEAQLEFQEIKERVMTEVSIYLQVVGNVSTKTTTSVNQVKQGPTR